MTDILEQLMDFDKCGNTASGRRDMRLDASAEIERLRTALQGMVDAFRPFTTRPMGGPNSDARLEQEAQISAYAYATSALSQSRGKA